MKHKLVLILGTGQRYIMVQKQDAESQFEPTPETLDSLAQSFAKSVYIYVETYIEGMPGTITLILWGNQLANCRIEIVSV